MYLQALYGTSCRYIVSYISALLYITHVHVQVVFIELQCNEIVHKYIYNATADRGNVISETLTDSKRSTKMLSLLTVLQVAIVWLPFSSAQETLPNLAVLNLLSDMAVSGHMCI